MITIKTLGHQWYWSYEYTDVSNLEFDSFMLKDNTVNRLLQVDNNTIIPINTQMRNLISSADVLHSWALPSLGVKADAIPGRLNQVNFYSNIPGVKFGQCSEICGANHRFIPIVLETSRINNFIKWLKSSNGSLDGWI
jgi:cytochrome c oxidase subunit 2